MGDDLTMSLEDKLVLISENENPDIKIALRGLGFVEKKTSEVFVEVEPNSPKFAVYVSEQPSLIEDSFFDLLLTTWKETYFFVIRTIKSDDSDSQRKRKYKNGDAKRVSEFYLDNISTAEGRVDFKNETTLSSQT